MRRILAAEIGRARPLLPPDVANDSHDGRIQGATRVRPVQPGVVSCRWLTSRPQGTVVGGMRGGVVDNASHDDIRHGRQRLNGAVA